MLIVRHAKWQIWFVVELNSVKIWQLFHFKCSTNIFPAYFIKFELFSEFQKTWSNYKKKILFQHIENCILFQKMISTQICVIFKSYSLERWLVFDSFLSDQLSLKYESISHHVILWDDLHLTHFWVTTFYSNMSHSHIMLFERWLVFDSFLSEMSSTQIQIIFESYFILKNSLGWFLILIRGDSQMFIYSPKLGPKTDQTWAWQIDTHHTSYPWKVWWQSVQLLKSYLIFCAAKSDHQNFLQKMSNFKG